MAAIDELSPANFDSEVFSSGEKLVVVYFWGPDCPNCEVFARHLPGLMPKIEALGVRLVKVNAYLYPELATRFGLHGIPTFILVRGGRPLGRMTSFQGDEYFLGVLGDRLGTRTGD
jgi:thioredoxin 1